MSGANRFDQPDEVWLEARDGRRLVGFVGLNRDPFASRASIGRLRHLYVARWARRRGVGRALVEAAVARAGSFERVRLRAGDAAAAAFYVRLGFDPVDEPHATHALQRTRGRREVTP